MLIGSVVVIVGRHIIFQAGDNEIIMHVLNPNPDSDSKSNHAPLVFGIT